MNEKYFCRTCKGLTNHKELFQIEKKGDDGDVFDLFQWFECYSILECLGCETVSFLKVYGDTYMVDFDYENGGNADFYFNKTIFPNYLSEGYEIDNSYLPENIRYIYAETVSALKSELYILTAGGLRAIIEALCNHLNISKKGDLKTRIDLMYTQNHLTLNESRRLHSIRFLGNDALHEIEKPNKNQLYLLLEIVNHLLANLFINDKKIIGKLETVIDSYSEFIRLIKITIKQQIVGKEMSMQEILGKSLRRVSKEKIIEFEQKLFEEITQDLHTCLKVRRYNTKQLYSIISLPIFYKPGISG